MKHRGLMVSATLKLLNIPHFLPSQHQKNPKAKLWNLNAKS
ncbi:hypothetical protein VCNHCC008D_003318 [Vibrio cholerae O1 str. NHCC-008D]|nr:hypothetical protein VCNHCC008D_003318 [Vibrio cholerae O1 str. NHCC-008D]